MPFKTILVAASGGSASDGALAMGCMLAARYGAHLEAYHVRTDPNEVIAAAAGAGAMMPMDSAWLDQMAGEADRLAAATKARFLEAVALQEVRLADRAPQDGVTAAWREDTGHAMARVAARARFFDLVVLGRSDRVVDKPSTDAIEATLLLSGRPVLLAPETLPAPLGDVVAVGWDGSPQAVRAMAAALPLLKTARTVILLTVGDRPEADAAAAVAYLAWHGVAAACQTVFTVPGVGRGEQLLAAARDAGADLLAMGAFSHAPWREVLFGGATRSIVGASLLPVLLAH
jgi:nucleotide-binding universal stress UspA family protein